MEGIGKKNITFKTRMMRFVLGLTVVTLSLLIVFGILSTMMDRNHEDSMERLLNLNTFYDHLDSINANVYEYTLEGDEEIYQAIESECMEGRRILKEMADMKEGIAFYRSIRDIEEMFVSYTDCIQKIYDHSYLCEEMTIGSKRVINKYYVATQDVYDAINSEFQNLYSQLLDAAENRKELMKRRNRIYFADFFLVIVCTVIYEAFYIRKMMKRVILPVQVLTESAAQFDGENLEEIHAITQEIEMDEEMRRLHQVYNSMILRIQKQVAEIRRNASAMEKLKDQELENLRISNMLRTSELRALQMQINPHFLFNTLNMISQNAYMENAEKTAGLLNKAARLLRYTLDNSNKSVTLAREIEILGNYVELQEQRFGNRISFEFDLDESFHQIQVPSMILQPLVENCITHGVGMKGEDAQIRILTRYEEKRHMGQIVIEDNGIGMDEATLDRVRREMKEKDQIDRKIGLSNVYLRLMIFFNYQATMEVFSGEETGTRIQIEMPYLPEAERHSDTGMGED